MLNIILTLLVISLSTLAVIILGVLVWALVVSARGASVSERPSKRTPSVCYVMDDEDYELSPCELVMKYKPPITDEEFERMIFDGKFANQIRDRFFVQPQSDMDMARMHQVAHQMAHQMAVDAHCVACQQAAELHNQACEMALHDAQMHNDMFNNSNPFF